MILFLSLSDQSRPGLGTVQQEVVLAAPEPAPVTPAESAYRTQREANERRLAKRAERRAAAAAGTIAHDAPSDNVCAECGSAFGEPAPVSITRPSTTPYALANYSACNEEHILTDCPHVTDELGIGQLYSGRTSAALPRR